MNAKINRAMYHWRLLGVEYAEYSEYVEYAFKDIY